MNYDDLWEEVKSLPTLGLVMLRTKVNREVHRRYECAKKGEHWYPQLPTSIQPKPLSLEEPPTPPDSGQPSPGH